MSEETTNGQVNADKEAFGQQETLKPEAKKAQRLENIRGLEDIVDTLTEDVVKALDIKEEKKRLKNKISKLKQEEMELKGVVGDLKSARDKMQVELQKRNDDISILAAKTEQLKSDKAKLSTEKVSLRDHLKNLEIEKEQMSTSLEKTNDMLMKLKHQIEAFDEEIKG